METNKLLRLRLCIPSAHHGSTVITMAPFLVTNQVEDQSNTPLTVNDQTSSHVLNLEGSQRHSLYNDTSAEEKASSNAIIGSDPNEVNWDGPDDVQNPQNWPVWRRAVIVVTITAIVFTTYVNTPSHFQITSRICWCIFYNYFELTCINPSRALASSIVAPTVPEIIAEFNYSKDGVAATLVVTIEVSLARYLLQAFADH